MKRKSSSYKEKVEKQKFESCVKKVKHQKGYNPYAVCRASIYK